MCKPLKKILRELCIRMRRGDVQRLITILVLCQKLLSITDFHPALRCKPLSDDADDQHVDGNANAAQLPQIFARNMHFSAGPPSKILRIYLKWKQETGFHLSEFLLTHFNPPSQLFKLLIHKSKNGLISSLEKGCSSCYWYWSPL